MDEYVHWWNDNGGRSPKETGENHVCVTASTSNALQMGLRHKPGLHEARPAANRLMAYTADPSADHALLCRSCGHTAHAQYTEITPVFNGTSFEVH
jgi:hypothetical protein